MGNLLFGWPLVKAANSNGAAGNFLNWHLPFEVYLPLIRFIR
jgi:hypothetical protein